MPSASLAVTRGTRAAMTRFAERAFAFVTTSPTLRRIGPALLLAIGIALLVAACIPGAAPDQRPMHRSDQRVMVGLDDRRPGDDEHVPARLDRWRHRPEHLTESPADPVPDHRSAQAAAGRKPESRRLEVGPQEPGGEEGMGLDGPGTLDRREFLRAREHHESRRVGAAPGRQAVSRFRPRARRAARIRRPPGVRIRARKPCSLARWRFLGW